MNSSLTYSIRNQDVVWRKKKSEDRDRSEVSTE
jgi:hypothetical protein